MATSGSNRQDPLPNTQAMSTDEVLAMSGTGFDFDEIEGLPDIGKRHWMLHPRTSEADGRLVIRYAGGIAALWIGLAVIGLVLGFATVGSGDNLEAAFAGLGLGVISTFVAWFAANPAIVADRTGIRVSPLFGTRTSFRWDEVRRVSLREVRASRGHGPALVLDASEDRDVKIDGLWVGATRPSLCRMATELERFVDSLDVIRPRFVHEVDGENENVF